MSSGAKTNVLVTQSGGCTPVMNRSLAAIFREALEHRVIGHIYGSRHALDGVLTEDLIDLRRISRASWDRIARTPGAALGSSRRKLQTEDVTPVLAALSKHNIGYWFIIGGNDSAYTGHTMAIESQAAGYPLKVVNVPKTIDNDLVLTDHSPGYGSAARFVALATMGAGQDARGMGQASPVTIIEVMGRDSGWLAGWLPRRASPGGQKASAVRCATSDLRARGAGPGGPVPRPHRGYLPAAWPRRGGGRRELPGAHRSPGRPAGAPVRRRLRPCLS